MFKKLYTTFRLSYYEHPVFRRTVRVSRKDFFRILTKHLRYTIYMTRLFFYHRHSSFFRYTYIFKKIAWFFPSIRRIDAD